MIFPQHCFFWRFVWLVRFIFMVSCMIFCDKLFVGKYWSTCWTFAGTCWIFVTPVKNCLAPIKVWQELEICCRFQNFCQKVPDIFRRGVRNFSAGSRNISTFAKKLSVGDKDFYDECNTILKSVLHNFLQELEILHRDATKLSEGCYTIFSPQLQ